MQDTDSNSTHDQAAGDYDQQVRAYNSYLHDALFGMSFEYVNPHDSLLDIGIGTGLASQPFARAGLEVHGCDASSEMLQVCAVKAFARELKVCDLHNPPLPYAEGFFNHVICCGVLHFFADLEPILHEVLRVIKPTGIFAFTIAAPSDNQQAVGANNLQDYIKRRRPGGYPSSNTTAGMSPICYRRMALTYIKLRISWSARTPMMLPRVCYSEFTLPALPVIRQLRYALFRTPVTRFTMITQRTDHDD